MQFQHAVMNAARFRIAIGRDAEKGRDREAKAGRIVLFGSVFAIMLATDRNQRDAKAIGVMQISETTDDFILADEFKLVEVFRMPGPLTSISRRNFWLAVSMV
ncbi:MAG: hypothetical protein K8R36_18580 [Planctomycetales bacterium]|nr:hypothetical protein [Planctomycetales bacterium]